MITITIDDVASIIRESKLTKEQKKNLANRFHEIFNEYNIGSGGWDYMEDDENEFYHKCGLPSPRLHQK